MFTQFSNDANGLFRSALTVFNDTVAWNANDIYDSVRHTSTLNSQLPLSCPDNFFGLQS